MKKIFVTGIGTGIGKTISCAVMCNVLGADYWKPVQSGTVEGTDSLSVAALVPRTKVHPEWVSLKAPLSPHAAAMEEGRSIQLSTLNMPVTDNLLVIEGAGGLMVPLNDKELIIDLIQKIDAPVVIVTQTYLGSINHTLLTIDVLRRRNIPIIGLIFNGEEVPATTKVILDIGKVMYIGNIPRLEEVSKESILPLSLNRQVILNHESYSP